MMELANCPLCDGPAVNKAFPGKVVQGWLGCPKCGLRIQWKISPDGAIRKWNRRAGGKDPSASGLRMTGLEART